MWKALESSTLKDMFTLCSNIDTLRIKAYECSEPPVLPGVLRISLDLDRFDMQELDKSVAMGKTGYDQIKLCYTIVGITIIVIRCHAWKQCVWVTLKLLQEDIETIVGYLTWCCSTLPRYDSWFSFTTHEPWVRILNWALRRHRTETVCFEHLEQLL